ncbi:hypothetical protein [Bacillus sp. Marseille-Q3570]|uniref:hypothetical protein n=1 Tax=Bacillus sp. Marseille-Q3570 TaxID=2963522 RepID=UPI0021B76F6B|nr:hypothetical protein [Bacillus sp. Marseille-Q3570]
MKPVEPQGIRFGAWHRFESPGMKGFLMCARHQMKPVELQGIRFGAWHFLKTVGAQGLNCGTWYNIWSTTFGFVQSSV